MAEQTAVKSPRATDTHEAQDAAREATAGRLNNLDLDRVYLNI